MAHALLSASGAHRWIACTPSAKLEEQFPDSTSTYAEEGTLAHELCEIKVNKALLGMSTKAYNSALKKIKGNDLYQTEMDKYTEEYLEYIQEKVHSFEYPPTIIVEKKVDFSDYVPEGFGTADCIILADGELHIVDFKYGKGVEVFADYNPQMMLYALGAYLEYSFLFQIDAIKMTIVQPRLNNISEFSIGVNELLEWADSTVRPKAQMAWNGEGDFVAGEHCKFCRAIALCRERARKNLEAEKFELKEGPLLSLDEIGEALKKAIDLAKWAEDLKEYALAESLKGNDIPGWKAVEGRGNRNFTDNDLAIKKLKEAGIAEELLYERKQYTLAQIEKMVGTKEFKKIVGDLVVKNPGKPTLVVNTDKREKITNKVTAAEDFADEI